MSEKVVGGGRGMGLVRKMAPYLAMVALQLGYAGMNIITKISLNGGMSHYVLVVYRHAFATAAIAPFALLFERAGQPKITCRVFLQIFLLGLLGPVLDLNFLYMGLKLTSPTFTCAMINILPAVTFVMAAVFRMEKVDFKKVMSLAKVMGTLITVGGAMLMALYKGPLVELPWSKHRHAAADAQAPAAPKSSEKDWFIGCIYLIAAQVAWAGLFILQKIALKTYAKHQLSLTSWVCFLGTLEATAVTFVFEHNLGAWNIGFDANLLTAAYSGIVASGIAYYVQGLVMKSKGPVFTTAFSPMMMIFSVVMGSFILAEKIYLGGVIGAVIIIIGLYSFLWGKLKEEQHYKQEMKQLPEVTKEGNNDIAA
ncbi:WAT1-related protein At5g07050-like [Andrographis paniculata]|uniref:WAT1-related protein At5g07050-like n=1 Tax=Andrographis paniculata TaxID=175694 RepID=UPI0021E6F586|nr:WAT1-related protein At5g07050-like [Andrographis paniculata]